MRKINKSLIASCGMNCGVCVAHLREKNPCPGCREVTADSPKTIFSCQIRICTERKKKYCLDCNKFPCEKLRHLDKRYREKYGMSEIENLEYIRDHGINKFIKNERQRWQSSKGIHCVHNKKYY
ncbi:MAG: DUF3795 domain-containing protein [Patescibacteria group bacterium]|jgi:hypothetical protein